MKHVAMLVACCVCLPCLHAAEKAELLANMNSQTAHFSIIAQKIWEFAEVGYKQTQCAALLKAEGFTITDNTSSIPTAFSASYGSGQPVIASPTEYDALHRRRQARNTSRACPAISDQP